MVAYDEVAEMVESRLERERVRRCLGSLTELQRESVTLAYYGGYTFREVAGLAGAVAAEPPAAMIGQALAAAARTRQLPPVTSQATARRTRRGSRDGGARPAPVPGRALLPRLALALAAVFLAAAAASGTVALHAEHRLGADQQGDQAVAQVLNAPDAVMLTARIVCAGG